MDSGKNQLVLILPCIRRFHLPAETLAQRRIREQRGQVLVVAGKIGKRFQIKDPLFRVVKRTLCIFPITALEHRGNYLARPFHRGRGKCPQVFPHFSHAPLDAGRKPLHFFHLIRNCEIVIRRLLHQAPDAVCGLRADALIELQHPAPRKLVRGVCQNPHIAQHVFDMRLLEIPQSSPLQVGNIVFGKLKLKLERLMRRAEQHRHVMEAHVRFCAREHLRDHIGRLSFRIRR